MRSREKSSKQSKGSKPPKSVMPDVFNSIKTLVISKWWDIHETGDFTILSKDSSKNKLYKLKSMCYDTWDEIQDQYIDEFGISKKSKEYYAAVAKVTILTCKFSLSQDKMDEFWLKLAIIDLDKFKKEEKQSNFKIKAAVENTLGCGHINPNTFMTIDYYHYVELAQQKQADGKRHS